MTPSPLLVIAQYKNRHDNKPRVTTVLWEAFTKTLTEHQPRRDKDGPLWSPTSYKTGAKRANEYVEAVSCFVADVDDGTSPDEFRKRWKSVAGETLAYCLHSSHSSTPDKPKWRVIFPLVAPVPGAEWQRMHRRLALALFGEHTDPACKDASRMYYLPSCPLDGLETAFADTQEGALLDPADFPDPEPEKPKQSQPQRDLPRGGSRVPVQKMLDQALFRAGTNGRNVTGMWLACQLRDNGYTEGEAEGVLLDYAGQVHQNGDRYEDSEALHSVRMAYKSGPREAWAQPGDRLAEQARRLLRTLGKEKSVLTPNDEPTPDDFSDDFNLTDYGNAERLRRRHGRDLRYCPAIGWLTNDGKRWCKDTPGEAMRRAQDTIRYIFRCGSAMLDQASTIVRAMADVPAVDAKKLKEEADALQARANELLKFAIKSEATPRLEAMLKQAQVLNGIEIEAKAFDAHPMLLNVQNGTVDLVTGELRPHRREEYHSRICPVVYNPDAKAPLFEKCLAQWQPDAEKRGLLLRAAGYTLTGQTGEETVFFNYGGGGNGKSKFIGSLEFVLGNDESGYTGRINATSLAVRRGENNTLTPELVDLPGVRMVVVSEIGQGMRLNEALLKDLTGNEIITVNPKHKAVFRFKPQFKPWMYGNHKPDVRGTDEGIRRRFPLIPWTVTIPKEDRDLLLDKKLEAEGEGILALFVRACLEWQKIKLSPPASIIEATKAYHEEQDVLKGFFDTCCVFASNAVTPFASLNDELKTYCEQEGLRVPSTSEFTERLQRQGCYRPDTGRRIGGKLQRVWEGVAIVTTRYEREAGPSVTPVTGVTGKIGSFVEKKKENSLSGDAVAPVTPVTGVTESFDVGGEEPNHAPDLEALLSEANNAALSNRMPDSVKPEVPLSRNRSTPWPRSVWKNYKAGCVELEIKHGGTWQETNEGRDYLADLEAIARWWHQARPQEVRPLPEEGEPF